MRERGKLNEKRIGHLVFFLLSASVIGRFVIGPNLSTVYGCCYGNKRGHRLWTLLWDQTGPPSMDDWTFHSRHRQNTQLKKETSCNGNINLTEHVAFCFKRDT